MSDSSGSGCGCGTFFFLLIIIGIAAVVTNPNESAHRRRIAQKTPVTNVLVGVMSLSGGMEFKYNNYIFFSVMTLDSGSGVSKSSIPGSFGIFGRVYYGDDKDD